jgi:hypothetical protein
MTYDQWKTESGYLERKEPEPGVEDERLNALELAWTSRAVLNDDDLPF